MAKSKLPVGVAENVLEISAAQFVQGMSSSDYAQDAGFGSSTVGVNPLITPGILYSTGLQTNIATSVAGNMIASCEDSQGIGAARRLFVDDAANYYSFNGSSLATSVTGTATGHYAFGKTDMAAVAGQTYVSLDDDIAQWNTSANTLIENWWTGTATVSGGGHPAALDSSIPHPLLNYANPSNPGTAMWVGNGNVLNFYDPVGNQVTVAQLTFQTNERIQALGIDPSTGLMLISTQQTVNISDTLSSRFFVYLHDGFSAQPRRKIPVEDLVTGFYNLGGTTFVGYGNKFGVWNGNGIAFLRALANATFSQTDLPYKHHITAAGNNLLVVDGANILAFGEITQGGGQYFQAKRFFYPYKNATNSNHLNLIANVGAMKIAINYAVGGITYFTVIDLQANAAGNGTFYGNKVYFPRPAFIRKMRVITTGISTTTGIGGVVAYNEDGITLQTANPKFVVPNGIRHTFDFFLGDPKVHTFQPQITFDSSQAFGLVRIIIYYDVAE